ncbi:hypothetical protein QJS10_CPA07g00426 [Acorus calamus]|uniref:FRIGIDA-like protein n=1 Tax=Acorus calamus TaxID=4465 RepID=A0AAV9EJ39_ACOCL|nr:hypothetical protein QJS10_CPA07g00426 [Acorus calamus]
MATDSISTTTISDDVCRSFEEISTQNTILTNLTRLYSSLTSHFASLDQTLTLRSQTLDSSLASFDSDTRHALDALEAREASIPSSESSSAAAVAHLRDSALADLAAPSSGDLDIPASIRRYCRRMDAEGLWGYVAGRRKHLVEMKGEIAAAVAEEAVDPARLVLDSVEAFIGSSSSERCWACGVILHALLPGEGGRRFGAGVVERAVRVAEVLKGRVEERREGEDKGASEGQLFLQVVAAFRLRERFEEGYLRGLILEFASRKETPRIALALGFRDKMGDNAQFYWDIASIVAHIEGDNKSKMLRPTQKDLIDELINNGKEVEAVYFVHESGLTERYPPVPLLKKYVQNSKKCATDLLRKANYSIAATDEANVVELSSIRSVIKCVEALKLDSEFKIDGLKRRAIQLEKAKMERKKSAASSKFQKKRPRQSPATLHPAKAGRTPNKAYPSFQRALQRNNPSASHFAEPYIYGGGPQQGWSAAPPQQQQFPYVPEGASGVHGGVLYGGPGSYSAGYDYATGVGLPPQPSYPQ